MLPTTGAMQQLLNELMLDHAILPAADGRPEPVAASKLLRDVFNMMTPIAARADVSLVLGPQTDDSMRLDYAQMLRVFSNIVGNATKYCAAGRTVELSARRHDDAVWLTVTDDGAGYSKEQKVRAFEAGWEGPEGLAQRGGTRRGLAIVHSLGQSNGGQVTLESEPGQGTRFIQRMPLV